MTTVIHHSADFDGLFCREIARHFLGDEDVHYIGWDFPDAPLAVPDEGTIYVLDLPVDRVFGLKFGQDVPVPSDNFAPFLKRVIWIDHHKSSIETHPADLHGYRIDGVAACRLAWQWFTNFDNQPCTCEGGAHSEGHYDYCSKKVLPVKEEFIAREVTEPLAVRLAGEYDIWDKRDPDAETFQFGLRSGELTPGAWAALLHSGDGAKNPAPEMVCHLLQDGELLQRYQQAQDASLVQHRSFRCEFEGLQFIALNTARCNSLTFAALDLPDHGHDALMGFYYNGAKWNFSLYHSKHRTDLDLSAIAVKYGGGGHRGACGFQAGTKDVSMSTGGKLTVGMPV